MKPHLEAENGMYEFDLAGRRILVIDDDPISLKVMRNILEEGGLGPVETVASGEAGIESIEGAPPDLVLLDIVMPGIEGFEVCRIVRRSSPARDIPVLMVTGGDADSEKSLEKSFRAGATDFITKPVRPIELLARVRSALNVKIAGDRLKQELARRIAAEKEKQKTIGELQKALAEIRTLGGLLPICASCKKVRDDEGYWTQIENYISRRSDAEFSHGICPECRQKYMEQLEKENRRE